MKAFLCGLALALGLVAFNASYEQSNRIEKLAAENERLRLFHAREVRRYKRPAPVPRGTENAQHILGTPANLVAAVWRQENGPPDIETGVLGRTDYFAKNSPIEDWAALETARTLNIYAWQWLQTAEGKPTLKRILQHASGPYIDKGKLGEKAAQSWAKNVYDFSQVK